MKKYYLIFIILILGIGGCKLGPEYQGPKLAMTDSYTQIDVKRGVEQQKGEDLAQWWTNLNDPVLARLLEEGVNINGTSHHGSLTLREMAWRLQQYRAQVGITRSELFPQVATDGSYTLAKVPNIDGTSENWSLGTSMSWELDVFGRLKRYTEASLADLESQNNLYWDAYILLLSNIATQYINVRAYQEQISIAEKNIEIRRNTLALTKELVVVGKSSQLDVSQAQGSLEAIEAELPTLRIGLRITLNRLSTLVGKQVGYVDDFMRTVAPMPEIPEEILVGIPVELIRRRPDIRAAEQVLIAQNARIGGAMGDLYPIFSLSGMFGLEADTISNLWSADSIATSVSPGFRWNILNFGKYRSNVRLQEAAFQEKAALYEETILLAVEEVDNALASYLNEKERWKKLNLAVVSYDKALKYSEERYKNGTTDFQRVLDSQREKLSYELQEVQSHANAVIDVIDLYRALGGGWQNELPIDTPPKENN